MSVCLCVSMAVHIQRVNETKDGAKHLVSLDASVCLVCLCVCMSMCLCVCVSLCLCVSVAVHTQRVNETDEGAKQRGSPWMTLLICVCVCEDPYTTYIRDLTVG